MKHWPFLFVGCALITSACENSSVCETMCNDLAGCGFLPSPLGAGGDDTVDAGPAALESARSDCASRCSGDYKPAVALDVCRVISDAIVGDAQAPSCTTPVAAGYTHFVRDIPDGAALSAWAGAAPNSKCDDLTNCVSVLFGQFALGRATVEFHPVLGSAVKPAANLTCDDGPQKVDSDYSSSSAIDEGTASALCHALGVDSATYFLERNGVHVNSDEFDCEFGLTFAEEMDVVPGVVAIGIRLSSESWSPTPDACWVFYSRRTLVSAGAGTTLIDVPIVEVNSATSMGLIPCERSVEACSDGLDNDADGLVDCADYDCLEISGTTDAATLCLPPSVDLDAAADVGDGGVGDAECDATLGTGRDGGC